MIFSVVFPTNMLINKNIQVFGGIECSKNVHMEKKSLGDASIWESFVFLEEKDVEWRGVKILDKIYWILIKFRGLREAGLNEYLGLWHILIDPSEETLPFEGFFGAKCENLIFQKPCKALKLLKSFDFLVLSVIQHNFPF